MLVKELYGEIHLKIVYFGPGMSGKTTNLQQIYAKVDPAYRGKLTQIKTREERTLFFDFMQIKMGKICGLTPRFNLYTVPGQSYYKATRKLVLFGVDGVVFVADSQPERFQENVQAFLDLKQFLREMNKSLSSVPTVIQCNKQDLDHALSPDILQNRLNAPQLHCYPAVATRSEGVFETLRDIVVQVGKMVTV